MTKTRYSQDAWKQLLQRLEEIPQSSLRVDKEKHVIKCRKHTDLVMAALRETARNKGYMNVYMFIAMTCK